ncbi:MAG: 2-C-methyl-D-erythritol 4-phosphate cytidylyltransferase [Pirellulaceae bacterium]
MGKFSVILPAAGQSTRFGDRFYKKVFAPLADRPVWLHSAERFLARNDVIQVILVISPEDSEEFHARFAANVLILGIDVTTGGESRSDSIAKGLAMVHPDAEFVAVHDAARPCLADAWIDRLFRKVREVDAAMLAVPVAATLKKVNSEGQIEQTISREQVWEAQTPQVFRKDLLVQAYANRDNFEATDDAQLVERLGKPVHVVRGSAMNLKITTKEDLMLAKHILNVLRQSGELESLGLFDQ